MKNKKTIGRSAGMIALFTLVSKGLGFLREVSIASKYGSGLKTDTYFVAMTATVLIMTSLGASLNTILIPIFSEIREKGGEESQKDYLSNMLGIIFLITLVIALLGFIVSPLIIRVLAKGFQGEQFQLAVRLNRIGMPIVILLGFTYVLSGYLQSNEIFTPHAIMGIPYNIIFLLGLGFLGGQGRIESLMVISILAAGSQILIQVPAVLGTGYRYRPRLDFRDPYLKKALILTMPILIGTGVNQINLIIDKTLASELVDGSISALTYSSRINEVIISVFVAAIATVIFPMLSRSFANGQMGEIRSIFKKGTNIILMVTVPATLGIMLLGEDVVRLFFQRNSFTSQDTLMTSGALFYYSLGLVASALRLMLNKIFYSFQDTRTPMINGSLAVIVNLILNLFLVTRMGHEGLALATSISALVACLLLLIDLRGRLGKLGLKSIGLNLIKLVLASSLMGLIVHLFYFRTGSFLEGARGLEFIKLFLSIGLGIGTYFGLCQLLRVEEIDRILRLKG